MGWREINSFMLLLYLVLLWHGIFGMNIFMATASVVSCLENREYGRRDPSRLPRGTLYPQKLAITSPTSDGCSVGIVRSRIQAMEFSFSLVASSLCELVPTQLGWCTGALFHP
jgi:hypothetical protein